MMQLLLAGFGHYVCKRLPGIAYIRYYSGELRNAVLQYLPCAEGGATGPVNVVCCL
jgi:hypothetical protein